MTKNKLKLVLPNRKYAASYLKMEREYQMEKNNIAVSREGIFKTMKDFPAYNRRMMNDRKGVDLEKGRIPSTLYWALAGNRVVGRLDLRHKLTKHLREVGGHIGYSVAPSERRKGYATEMLRLGLKKAKKLGIKKVMVSCNEENTGSRKVIEKNGGVLENKVKFGKIYKLRFWIKN